MSVEGERALRRRWEKLFPKKLKRKVRKALEKGAEEITDYMRLLVPKDERDLLNSIGWTWGNAPSGSVALGSVEGGGDTSEFRITIYAGNEQTIVTNSRGIRFQNALIQEFGTKKNPANPFFFVAYRALRRRTRGRITRDARKTIKEAN